MYTLEDKECLWEEVEDNTGEMFFVKCFLALSEKFDIHDFRIFI